MKGVYKSTIMVTPLPKYVLLVKSSQWSIINATFWLVELPLGYML